MRERGLPPYAWQVLKMMESKGGCVNRSAIVEMLIEDNPDVDNSRAHEIRSDLADAGFIWYERHNVRPGIPSLIDHFKAEEGM